MSEEKSYLGLVLWLAGFLVGTVLCMYLPESMMLRGVMQLCSLGICVLVGMIWYNEKIYWINGVTFEEAMKATAQQRKRFAMRHLKIFLWFAVPYFLFSCLSWALGWSEWIDFALGTAGTIGCALATMPIKLENCA